MALQEVQGLQLQGRLWEHRRSRLCQALLPPLSLPPPLLTWPLSGPTWSPPSIWADEELRTRLVEEGLSGTSSARFKAISLVCGEGLVTTWPLAQGSLITAELQLPTPRCCWEMGSSHRKLGHCGGVGGGFCLSSLGARR